MPRASGGCWCRGGRMPARGGAQDETAARRGARAGPRVTRCRGAGLRPDAVSGSFSVAESEPTASWHRGPGCRDSHVSVHSRRPGSLGPALNISRKMGQKKQRLTEIESQLTPSDTADSSPKERPPSTLVLQRSIYFSSPKAHPARLGLEFFDQPAIALARAFLGQVLVRRLADGTELRGRIVETEAYLGPEDEAAHSRGGRQTPRNRGMFMKPGTLYVYIIYGMYFCLNVSSQGEGACVLLRALEPLEGVEMMRQLRSTLRKGTISRVLKDRRISLQPRLTWNSLCSLRVARAHSDPPTSVSQCQD